MPGRWCAGDGIAHFAHYPQPLWNTTNISARDSLIQLSGSYFGTAAANLPICVGGIPDSKPSRTDFAA